MLDEVLLGLVRYGDAGPPRYDLIHFLFMKREHFDKERELRSRPLWMREWKVQKKFLIRLRKRFGSSWFTNCVHEFWPSRTTG